MQIVMNSGVCLYGGEGLQALKQDSVPEQQVISIHVQF